MFLLGMPLIGQPPPQNTNPTVPDAQSSPEKIAQSDHAEQSLQDKVAGNERIQDNLQSAFDDDPTLNGTEVVANVDDENITLTGTVQSYLQHQRILQLVSPYYSYRMVMDKVRVQ
jgi:osmotically-inducible protein OsmY